MIWTLLWVGWMLAFLAIEVPAVIRPAAGDTLSEHIWKIWGRDERLSPWVRARRILFLGFWAWLTIHFLFAWA